MRWYGWVAILVAAVGATGWIAWERLSGVVALKPDGPEAKAALAAAVAAQDEEAFYKPSGASHEIQPANPLKNVYFGDLHIHSSLSADAYLIGNRLDLDAAYRIAKGESAEIASGERVELTRPLDFAAVTDHAEGFGSTLVCNDAALDEAARESCGKDRNPSSKRFRSKETPNVRPLSVPVMKSAASSSFSRLVKRAGKPPASIPRP